MNISIGTVNSFLNGLLSNDLDHIQEADTPEIVAGDYVRYWCDDTQAYQVGVYRDLWLYITQEQVENGTRHPDCVETSPYPRHDAFNGYATRPRYDAYIETPDGTTYANCDTITKITEMEYIRMAYADIDTVIV